MAEHKEAISAPQQAQSGVQVKIVADRLHSIPLSRSISRMCTKETTKSKETQVSGRGTMRATGKAKKGPQKGSDK
jgi:hypothetical protein